MTWVQRFCDRCVSPVGKRVVQRTQLVLALSRDGGRPGPGRGIREEPAALDGDRTTQGKVRSGLLL